MHLSRRLYGIFLAIIGIVLFLYLLRQRVEGFQEDTESKTADLVIARYKESLDWLDEYKDIRFKNVFIYNKSNSPAGECTNEYADCIVKNLPNVGVCDHTYLHHIVENYDRLADVTIFAPGSANLQHKKDIFKFTTDRALMTKNTVMNVYKFDIDVEEAMYNFRMVNYIGASPENNDGNNFNNYPASPTPFGVWFKQYFPEVHTRYSTFLGIFAASRDTIRQRPKAFYESLIKQVNKKTFHEASHFIERAWFAIMSPVPENCIYVSPELTGYINNIGAFRNVRRQLEGFEEMSAKGSSPALKYYSFFNHFSHYGDSILNLKFFYNISEQLKANNIHINYYYDEKYITDVSELKRYVDTETLSLYTMAYKPADAIDIWMGDDIDNVSYKIFDTYYDMFYRKILKQIGLDELDIDTSLYQKEDNLIDIYSSLEEKFKNLDILIVNANPKSEQIEYDKTAMDAMCVRLAARYKIATTTFVNESIPCTFRSGLKIQDIGAISTHAKYIIAINTGPIVGCFNLYTKQHVKKWIILDKRPGIKFNMVNQVTTTDIANIEKYM
jgi:hypothetical protein